MYSKFFKPLMTYGFALILTIVLSPLFLVVTILIKATSPGEAIFVQKRLGKHGKPFNIYKFRTMVKDAYYMGTGAHTYEGDPRITPVGRILRKTSIDELPQLINMLKGEMCFIGPRPLLDGNPYKYEDYPEEYKARFLVKPGMFCSVDVQYRAEADIETQLSMDCDYVKTMSFMNDIKVFFGTFLSVIMQKGIYQIEAHESEETKK